MAMAADGSSEHAPSAQRRKGSRGSEAGLRAVASRLWAQVWLLPGGDGTRNTSGCCPVSLEGSRKDLFGGRANLPFSSLESELQRCRVGTGSQWEGTVPHTGSQPGAKPHRGSEQAQPSLPWKLVKMFLCRGSLSGPFSTGSKPRPGGHFLVRTFGRGDSTGS